MATEKLPFAALRYSFEEGAQTGMCEVQIDGKTVAQLPTSDITLSAPHGGLPTVQITVPVRKVGGLHTILPKYPPQPAESRVADEQPWEGSS